MTRKPRNSFEPELGAKIMCQEAHKINDQGKFGCFRCGGYGWLLRWEVACTRCLKGAWISNHEMGMTLYDAKVIYSWDGLRRVWHPAGQLCGACDDIFASVPKT